MADHTGIHTHRFRENPAERQFAEAWRDQQRGRTLDYLMLCHVTDQRFVAAVSERDETVAATVIQWLGSPVGQAFLRGCGFVPAEVDRG